MARHARWEDIKKCKEIPDGDVVARVERDLDLGQAIFDARTEAGPTRLDLAERLGTTAGVIAPMEEGGSTAGFMDVEEIVVLPALPTWGVARQLEAFVSGGGREGAPRAR